MSDWSFIVAAFGLTWVTVAVYAVYTWKRLRDAKREYEQVVAATEEHN